MTGKYESDAGCIGWSAMMDHAAAMPELADRRAALVAEARKRLEMPLVRRVYRYEDMGKHRTWLDGRAKALEPEIREIFALAMSDCSTNGTVAGELPLLAAALRFTGDTAFEDRIVEQLTEMATWSPLQRPGWTCYSPGAKPPAVDRGYNWLATGVGVRAIAMTLPLLPEGCLDATLLGRFEALLDAEIESIVEDWRVKRTWFIQTDNPITNQWVLPTEGLVTACILRGRGAGDEAYELGVENLVRAIDSHGDHGEFEEGLSYGSMTVTSMLHGAHAMACAHDTRALERPFLKRYGNWALHHLLPGRMGINSFDGGSSPLPRQNGMMRSIFSLLVTLVRDPAARWALEQQFDGPEDGLVGLAAAANIATAVPSSFTPGLYGAWDKARHAVWRSAWADDATGIWVRGGHEDDQHDHRDRGHVGFVLHGRPVLIETGSVCYHYPNRERLFSSAAGHNVPQLGDPAALAADPNAYQDQKKGWRFPVAPIHVERLADEGGDLIVDLTGCYEGLEMWERRVRWSAESLDVEDRMSLAADCPPRKVLLRWHTACENPDELRVTREDDKHLLVSWTARPVEACPTVAGDLPVTMRISADVPIDLKPEIRENQTLHEHNYDRDGVCPKHVCLVLTTVEAVNICSISMSANREAKTGCTELPINERDGQKLREIQ